MENTDRLPPRPYRRRSEEEWAEIKQLYEKGASAKALVDAFGGTERTIYSRLSKDGCLRKDLAERETPLPLSDDEAEAKAGGIQNMKEHAPVRTLTPESPPEEAARRAYESGLLWFIRGDVTKAYQVLRLSGLLERLGRLKVMEQGEGTSAAQAAVLEFLMGRLTGDEG